MTKEEQEKRVSEVVAFYKRRCSELDAYASSKGTEGAAEYAHKAKLIEEDRMNLKIMILNRIIGVFSSCFTNYFGLMIVGEYTEDKFNADWQYIESQCAKVYKSIRVVGVSSVASPLKTAAQNLKQALGIY